MLKELSFVVMRKKEIFLGLCIILHPFLAGATSIYEAMSAAYSYHPLLKQSRVELEAVDEGASQALSGWLPSINATASRGKQFIDSNGAYSDSIQDTKSVTLSQPLFRGGQTMAEMKKAKHDIHASRADLVATEQSVLLDTAIAYMDALEALEVLKLNEKNYETFKKHLDRTEKRFEIGDITKTDVFQAEAQLLSAEASLIEAQGKLSTVKAEYKRVTGTSFLEPLTVPDVPTVVDNTKDTLVGLGLKIHPTVVSYQNKVNSQKQAVHVEQADLLPKLSLNASSSITKGGGFVGDLELNNDQVTVDLTVPVYAGGLRYSKVRQAKKRLKEAEYDLEGQEEIVRKTIVEAYHNYQTAKTVIRSKESSVKSFESVLAGVEKEAETGARTTLDVLDAEKDLFSSKAELISAQRDLIVNAFTLLSSIGRLTADEMGLDVQKYNDQEYYNSIRYQIIGF